MGKKINLSINDVLFEGGRKIKQTLEMYCTYALPSVSEYNYIGN